MKAHIRNDGGSVIHTLTDGVAGVISPAGEVDLEGCSIQLGDPKENGDSPFPVTQGSQLDD